MTGQSFGELWHVQPTLDGVTLTHLLCRQVVAVGLPQPITLDRLAAVIADHHCPEVPRA